MIVKYLSNALMGESWELIDSVTSVRYARISSGSVDKYNDIPLNDRIEKIDKHDKLVSGLNHVCVQMWHHNELEPINIITNMSVFALNDEGKTVERIN